MKRRCDCDCRPKTHCYPVPTQDTETKWEGHYRLETDAVIVGPGGASGIQKFPGDTMIKRLSAPTAAKNDYQITTTRPGRPIVSKAIAKALRDAQGRPILVTTNDTATFSGVAIGTMYAAEVVGKKVHSAHIVTSVSGHDGEVIPRTTDSIAFNRLVRK